LAFLRKSAIRPAQELFLNGGLIAAPVHRGYNLPTYPRPILTVGWRRLGISYHNSAFVYLDGLHSLTPEPIMGVVQHAGKLFDKLPILREVASSLYTRAIRPCC